MTRPQPDHGHPHGSHEGPPAPAPAHGDHGHGHGAHDEAAAPAHGDRGHGRAAAGANGGHPHDDHGDHGDHGGHDHGAGGHEHPTGLWGKVREVFAPHSHDAADSVDSELEASQLGIRTLIISFAGLAVTAVLQLVVVLLSNSVALLGDTLHNFADALTAIPLAIAFTLGRRAATRRFTYGYGRAEDLAGLVVVLLITASSVLAAYVAFRRLLHPDGVDHLVLVEAASLIGFVGNETVARYRITVGRRIGSAALVADGLHARTDGLTSLAVLFGAGGVALGFPLADPIVGLLITVAILGVLRQAAREVFGRLMDAVDPALLTQAEASIRATPGVLDVGDVRLRWVGHALRAECQVVVAPDLTVVQAHQVAEAAEHRLLHDVRRLTAATVHADPYDPDPHAHHGDTSRHRARLTPDRKPKEPGAVPTGSPPPELWQGHHSLGVEQPAGRYPERPRHRHDPTTLTA
jgi:cation diffusion facilitator family transporter